jgi:hypothetical protein
VTESASEPVGSVSEEAFKLFRALTASSSEPKSDEPHVCTATWCPVCQVVGLVRDNPDAVAQVSASAAAFARSLRDLVDSAIPTKPTPPEDEEA